MSVTQRYITTQNPVTQNLFVVCASANWILNSLIHLATKSCIRKMSAPRKRNHIEGQLFTISVEQCNSLPGNSVLTVALENFTIKKSFTASAIHQNASLKRQCQEICCRFFAEKIWPGPHMNSQKQFCKLFRFHENMLSQKLENRVSMTPCRRSQQLQWHCVREVNDNATLYSHSQWLRCELNNYFSTCLRSQLCTTWTRNFWKYQITFFVTLIVWHGPFKPRRKKSHIFGSKSSRPCLRGAWRGTSRCRPCWTAGRRAGPAAAPRMAGSWSSGCSRQNLSLKLQKVKCDLTVSVWTKG